MAILRLKDLDASRERHTPEPSDFTRSLGRNVARSGFSQDVSFWSSIVVPIAQLTSFHDALTFPLTDVTIPPLLKPVISDFSLDLEWPAR